MEHSSSSGARERLSAFMKSLHGWLIRIGLASPPDDLEHSAKPLTDEQRKVRRELGFLAEPRPPRYHR